MTRRFEEMDMRIAVVALAGTLLMGCVTAAGDRCADSDETAAPVQVETEQQKRDVEDTADDEMDDGETSDRRQRLSPWSREGLEVQPNLDDLKGAPEWEPATTEWRPSERRLSKDLTRPETGETFDQLGPLVYEVAGELRFDVDLGRESWEQTMRIYREDDREATGIILRWGYKDDALAGSDLRIEMRRADDGWFVDELRERFHCRRGITDDGLCI